MEEVDSRAGRNGQVLCRNRGPQESRRALRLGGDVEATKLVHKVMPVYPAAAKTAGIQGTAILQAVIGMNGTPLSLRIMNNQMAANSCRSLGDKLMLHPPLTSLGALSLVPQSVARSSWSTDRSKPRPGPQTASCTWPDSRWLLRRSASSSFTVVTTRFVVAGAAHTGDRNPARFDGLARSCYSVELGFQIFHIQSKVEDVSVGKHRQACTAQSHCADLKFVPN
jgi:hypothetical protein